MIITSITGHSNGGANSTICMYMCLSLLCEEVGLQREGKGCSIFYFPGGWNIPQYVGNVNKPSILSLISRKTDCELQRTENTKFAFREEKYTIRKLASKWAYSIAHGCRHVHRVYYTFHRHWLMQTVIQLYISASFHCLARSSQTYHCSIHSALLLPFTPAQVSKLSSHAEGQLQ